MIHEVVYTISFGNVIHTGLLSLICVFCLFFKEIEKLVLSKPGYASTGSQELEEVEIVRVSIFAFIAAFIFFIGVGLGQWSERCASIPKITGLNPSGGSELTFCYDSEHSLSLPVCCVTRVTHSALSA
jgi:hypothetical protein